MLAARSLETISPRYVLELSHMGILSGILAETGLSEGSAKKLLTAMAEKNPHELSRLCEKFALSENVKGLLRSLCLLSGPAGDTVKKLLALPLPKESRLAAMELADICRLLEAFGSYNICLDLSVLNDTSYYNGLIFRGYVDGIAVSVLSGGRYDRLLEKMGKEGGAIGFAVYLDELGRFLAQKTEHDVDVLLVYCPEADLSDVASRAQALTAEGKTIHVQPDGPVAVTYRQKIGPDGKEIS